jgi:hypothetical protein
VFREKADALVGRSFQWGQTKCRGAILRALLRKLSQCSLMCWIRGLLHNMDDGIQVYDLKRPSQQEFVHRLIDYSERSRLESAGACGVLDEKRRERGVVYREHYRPRDLDNNRKR